MSSRLPAAAFAALALATAAAADATAAPWSQPVTIADGIPQVDQPSIAFAGDGSAVVSARLRAQPAGLPSSGFSRLWGRPAGGGFAGSGRSVLAAAPVAFGAGRVALLRLPVAGGTFSDDDLPDGIGYELGRCCDRQGLVGGRWRRLSPRADRGQAALAANARGDVAAAWVEHFGSHDHVVVAVRRRGRAFGRPAVVSRLGFAAAPSVAVGAGGDVLVAYRRTLPRGARAPRRSVQARARRGGRWGGAQRLGATSDFSVVATAAAANGRLLVGWGSRDLVAAGAPWIVRAATRAPGARGFGAAQILDAGERGVDGVAGTVAAAIAVDGTATVAWTHAGSGFPARVATAGPRSRFAAAQTLAAGGAVGDVAIDARGAALVVWATPTTPSLAPLRLSGQVFASLRPRGAAAFGAPEAVGPAERADLPRVAFDPATGGAAVVWISRVPGVAQALRFAERIG